MAKAKKRTTVKTAKRKRKLSFWDRVANGVEKLFSSAFPKRGR
jgi:hypothetical protein|tara:strand:- start:7132 stop:7260 length:129 start_codon:yes stop_codon:yes gene_type:complete